MSEAQAVKIAELQQTNAELKDVVVDLLKGSETGDAVAWDRTKCKARDAAIKAIEGDG